MPPIINTSGYKAGSIYRIKLVNFVTYKNVELYPGKSLNMIIGPNGTGKSTFVSALILGLCGNIASIGRAKQISEYVRSGCEEASIEIELYQEKGMPNVKITRVFNLKEVSKWYIDNKPVNQQKIKELMAKFDIQVDNLCQLLPQDRVKEFAQLKPHELLINTLSAIGEQKKVDELNRLKNWRSEQCGLQARLEKSKKRRMDLIKENEILQGRIDTFNKRKEIENEIKACERKKLWLEADILKKELQSYEKDIKAAEAVVKRNKKKLEPFEETRKRVDNEIKQLENHKLSVNANINDLNNKMVDAFNLVNIQNNKIEEHHAWYLEQQRRRDREAQELEEERAKLDRLQVDLAEAMAKYGDETQANMEHANLRKKVSDLEKEKNKLKVIKQDIQNSFERNEFPQIAQYQSRIRMLEDVDRKRLQTLQGYSSDAHQALLWLRENRGLFQGAVCGPMMLEIKFPEPRYARYLESTVSNRDLLAFTFLHAEDMNLFLRKMRQELGLKQVNAVCSPPANTVYQSPDIENIRQYGFQTYLVDTFTADAMIVRYLCRTYHVHRIPIGNDYTYQHSERVPADITLFFSDKHRFSVKISKYSGERCTSFGDVHPPKLLADVADVDKINEYKAKLSELKVEQQRYEERKLDLNGRLAALDDQCKKYIARQTEIEEIRGLIRRLSVKIRSQEATVEQRSRPTVDLQQIKAECERKQRECVAKQVTSHCELAPVLADIHAYTLRYKLLTMALQKKRSEKVQLENDFHELNRELSEAMEQLQAKQQLATEAQQRASAKRAAALRASDNRSPEHAAFPERALHARLPATLPALRDHCDQLRTRIDCMAAGDEGEVQTYEKNKEEIERLAAEENDMSKEYGALDSTMAKTKARWIRFVRALIEEINLRFREMFQKLGFGGEVHLRHGPSEDDFSTYGVNILVKFRSDEALRALNPFEQSGGERAVSTAVYLFALQRRARVPFRCVDEINQGMDSTNERKIFEFLVNVTTEGQHGQYFLLTPKLLTGLKYNENVTVHTIMNGRGAVRCDQWRMDAFLPHLRNYKQCS